MHFPASVPMTFQENVREIGLTDTTDLSVIGIHILRISVHRFSTHWKKTKIIIIKSHGRNKRRRVSRLRSVTLHKISFRSGMYRNGNGI